MSTFLRIDINLFSAFFLAIVFSLAYRRLDHTDPFNRLYFQGCAVMMTLTLVEALTCVLNRNPDPAARWTAIVLHVFLFALPAVITYYWFLLANTLTRQGNVSDIKAGGPLMIPAWLGVALSIASPFFRWVYDIDINGVYHRGPLFVVEMVICYGYLLMGFILLIKRRKSMIEMDFRFLTLFCLMPLIGGLVQGLIYGVLLMWASSCCALTILYLYLQERMIQTDYLTGAWTRNSFEYYLSQKLKADQKNPFGVVYVDIDNLKTINDRYGHAEGDVAIKATVLSIREVLRKGDAIARLGGDEFAILLNISSRETLDAIAQRIRTAVSRYNDASGKPYRLTLSLGGDIFIESAENTVDSIVNKADRLMYANKRCVCGHPLVDVGQDGEKGEAEGPDRASAPAETSAAPDEKEPGIRS